MLQKILISKRFANDGTSLGLNNDIQREYIAKFKKDPRIKYQILERCPLCSHTDLILIAEQDCHGVPLETVVCDRCGLIFTHNQMTEESTKIFYSEHYRRIYQGIREPDLESYRPQYQPKGEFGIPQFLKRNSVVVDIGTGGGWSLLKFKTQGFTHYGFDYDENLVNFGREQFGLNLYVGSIEKAREMGVKGDYLILSQVLEHILDPVKFLVEVREILNDKALIKITVPSRNLLFIGGSATGYDFRGTLQKAHNFFFDEFTLRYLALKTGYRVRVILGEYIILENDCKYSSRKTKNAFKTNHRGKKVIKYLRFCESLVPLKNKIVLPCYHLKLCYLYYLLKPISTFRLYWLFRPQKCSKMGKV